MGFLCCGNFRHQNLNLSKILWHWTKLLQTNRNEFTETTQTHKGFHLNGIETQLKLKFTKACFMIKTVQAVYIDGSVCRSELFWQMALKISKTDYCLQLMRVDLV